MNSNIKVGDRVKLTKKEADFWYSMLSGPVKRGLFGEATIKDVKAPRPSGMQSITLIFDEPWTDTGATLFNTVNTEVVKVTPKPKRNEL